MAWVQAVASAAGLNPSKSYGNLQGQGDAANSDSGSSGDVLAKHGIERVRPPLDFLKSSHFAPRTFASIVHAPSLY